MKTLVLCLHGWGLDDRYFANLFFQKNSFDVRYLNLGHYGQEYLDFSIDGYDKIIGIGHSIGFAKLLISEIKFDYIISFAGFARYLNNQQDVNFHRTLRKNLVKNPIEFVKAIHKLNNVNMIFDYEKLNIQKIISDFDFLEIVDVCELVKKFHGKGLHIYYDSDPVLLNKSINDTLQENIFEEIVLQGKEHNFSINDFDKIRNLLYQKIEDK